MKFKIGLTAGVAIGLVATASLGVMAQDDGAMAGDDSGALVSPGPLGRTYSQWASDWIRVQLSVPFDASVGVECAAGDQGDVFFVLVDTEDLSACAIREDQYILQRARMLNCEIPVDTFDRARDWRFDITGASNRVKRVWEGRTGEAAALFVCQYGIARNHTDVTVTVDGVTTALDESNLVMGIPFEFEYNADTGDPGRFTIIPSGIIYMLEPLAAGPHPFEIRGIHHNRETKTGDAYVHTGEIVTVPAKES